MYIPALPNEIFNIMLATLKSQVFIDTLILELTEQPPPHLKAVLRDERGKVCSIFETPVAPAQKVILWEGLNDLPYGVYLLELTCEQREQRLRLVKRV
jgi:hypothetical protein